MNIYIQKYDAGGRGLSAGGAAAASVPALPLHPHLTECIN